MEQVNSFRRLARTAGSSSADEEDEATGDSNAAAGSVPGAVGGSNGESGHSLQEDVGAREEEAGPGEGHSHPWGGSGCGRSFGAARKGKEDLADDAEAKAEAKEGEGDPPENCGREEDGTD